MTSGMRWQASGELRWLETELPAGQCRATVAFSARHGGVSAGPYESLNLGVANGDRPDDVAENRLRLAAALGLGETTIATGRQVHGDAIAWHDTPPAAPLREVDGHATDREDLPMMVLVADCLPVALAGPGGAAILHCGWRSLAEGILARGVTAVGASAAAIGPGIGPCCYEVGDEVLGHFAHLGAGVADGRMLDLAEVARLQLADAGVDEVESAGLCTSCEPDLFFSHRRDRGQTGRQAGIAWLS